MKKWVIIAAFLLSLLGAVINNLVTDDPVDWTGSPCVLELPEGF